MAIQPDRPDRAQAEADGGDDGQLAAAGRPRLLFLNNQGLGSMGGGVTILRQLAADLARDHAVTVASFDAPADAPNIVQVMLKRPPAPGRAWRMAPAWRALALARLVPAKLLRDADIVVALDCHFAHALRRWRPRRLLYVSLSCIPRQEWFAASGMQRVVNALQYAWLERRMAQAADALVAASRMHAADLRRYGRITRPATVLYPVFRNPAQPAFAPTGPPTILLAGRIEPGKNMGVAIKLAHRLRDLPCRWVIAGDGPGRAALQAQAAAAGLADRVQFAGAVPDLTPLLARSAIFLHPSHYESFGIVVFEAMRAGLPVLCGRAAGCAEVVRDGIDGHIADFGNLDAVAASLRALVGDAVLRARMGQAAQATAQRLLDQDYCAEFRRLIAGLG